MMITMANMGLLIPIIAIACLLIVIIFYYIFTQVNAYKIECYNYENKQVSKTTLEDNNGKRIVFFSDLHLGLTMNKKAAKKAIDKVASIPADLYIFGGDIIGDLCNKLFKKEDIGELFLPFKDKRCIAIVGNHEFKPSKHFNSDERLEYLKATNFELLIDSYYDFENIKIYGMNESIYHTVNYSNINADIILSHEGDVLDKVDTNCLMLSGHTHGGQIKIPFIPFYYKPKLGKKYIEGFYKVDNKSIIVSKGLGCNLIKVRFFAPSDIIVVNIK